MIKITLLLAVAFVLIPKNAVTLQGQLECPICADIVVLADRSSSVGGWRWRNQIIPFLEKFANNSVWSISRDYPSKSENSLMQIAVISFGTEARLEWNWGDIETDNSLSYKEALHNEYQMVFQIGDLTNTGAAMNMAVNEVLTGIGRRLMCDRICVLVSDGETNPGNHATILMGATYAFSSLCKKTFIVHTQSSVNSLALQLLIGAIDADTESLENLTAVFDIEQIICSYEYYGKKKK